MLLLLVMLVLLVQLLQMLQMLLLEVLVLQVRRRARPRVGQQRGDTEVADAADLLRRRHRRARHCGAYRRYCHA